MGRAVVKDALWNLAWALPLVLLAGLVAALALRRVLTQADAALPARRSQLCELLEVSSTTRLYVIEVDRQPYLLVESAMPASLHAMVAAPSVPKVSGAIALVGWLRSRRR